MLPCALPISSIHVPWPQATNVIRWRFGSKIDFFPCRTSSEKNRVAPILGSIKHGALFIKSKRPITMFRQSCRHYLSRSQSRSFHTFRGFWLCFSESSKWTQSTQNTCAPPKLWRRCGRNRSLGMQRIGSPALRYRILEMKCSRSPTFCHRRNRRSFWNRMLTSAEGTGVSGTGAPDRGVSLDVTNGVSSNGTGGETSS